MLPETFYIGLPAGDAAPVPTSAQLIVARLRRDGWPAWAIVAWEAGRRRARSARLRTLARQTRDRDVRVDLLTVVRERWEEWRTLHHFAVDLHDAVIE